MCGRRRREENLWKRVNFSSMIMLCVFRFSFLVAMSWWSVVVLVFNGARAQWRGASVSSVCICVLVWFCTSVAALLAIHNYDDCVRNMVGVAVMLETYTTFYFLLFFCSRWCGVWCSFVDVAVIFIFHFVIAVGWLVTASTDVCVRASKWCVCVLAWVCVLIVSLVDGKPFKVSMSNRDLTSTVLRLS